MEPENAEVLRAEAGQNPSNSDAAFVALANELQERGAALVAERTGADVEERDAWLAALDDLFTLPVAIADGLFACV